MIICPDRTLFVRILFVVIAFILIGYTAQAETVTSDGNWDNSGIWSGGNIGDALSEDVLFNNNLPNTGIVTVRNGYTYTIGNLNMQQGNELTIASGGILNVGSSGAGNERDLTTGNTTTINVYGDLTIYGDLNMGNTLTLNITGTLTIIGDLIGGNNATLTVNGDLSATNLDVGNGSTISGTGTISLSGTCTDGNSSFCGEGPLPVELLYFKANDFSDAIELNWATASESYNDFFTIERSAEGIKFVEIATVQGNGTTNETSLYSYTDDAPAIGTTYYRLSQTDFDGTVEYFNIIAVNPITAHNAGLKVYPNPVRNLPFKLVATGLSLGEKVRVSIINTAGLEVFTSDRYVNASGVISIGIDALPGLSKGFYVIKVNKHNLSLSQKLIIL